MGGLARWQQNGSHSSTPVLASIPVGRFYPNVAPVFAVDEQTGYVYLGMDGPSRGTGMIGILDSATGRLVRIVPVPFEVGSIAVDPRTARLFVAAEGGQRGRSGRRRGGS